MQQGPNIYQIKFEPDLPEDVLIAADVDGMEQRICGEDIYPYWEYIYENEGGFVETDGRYILCVLHTAGMQGGVVMFWGHSGGGACACVGRGRTASRQCCTRARCTRFSSSSIL